MTGADRTGEMPTFLALDHDAVLAGERRAASIQLDESFFAGQTRALAEFEDRVDARASDQASDRLRRLRASQRRYEAIDVGVESVTAEGLWDASRRFRDELQQLPVIVHLKRECRGRCFVVPEWLKSGDRLHYGARVYLLRPDDSATPEAVIGQNVEAVLDDAPEAFERYQGRLHGYPECCIESYHTRAPTAPSPEWRAVEPYAGLLRDDGLERGASVSIDAVVPAFDEWGGKYGFFAREFFPDPGCAVAESMGRDVFGALTADWPDRLVEDHFRLRFGHAVLVARAVHAGASTGPQPGDLGREHLLFWLPPSVVTADERYDDPG
jgi:hypothetical protein